jgi:hypothetical protein
MVTDEPDQLRAWIANQQRDPERPADDQARDLMRTLLSSENNGNVTVEQVGAVLRYVNSHFGADLRPAEFVQAATPAVHQPVAPIVEQEPAGSALSPDNPFNDGPRTEANPFPPGFTVEDTIASAAIKEPATAVAALNEDGPDSNDPGVVWLRISDEQQALLDEFERHPLPEDNKFKVVNWTLVQEGLSPVAVNVLKTLGIRGARTARCRMKTKNLALTCGYTSENRDRYIFRALEELKAAGLLVVIPRKDRKTNKRLASEYVLAHWNGVQPNSSSGGSNWTA